MNTAPEAFLARALELPEADRADLAYRLLRGLGPEVTDREPGYEESWAAELEERHRKFEADLSQAIPAEEFFERLHQTLRQGRVS